MQEKLSFDTSVIWNQIQDLATGFIKMLPQITFGIITFILFYILSGVVRNLVRKAFERTEKRNVGTVVGRLAKWAMLIGGFLISAMIMIPSVTPGSIISGLGIGGVAIGFAFKDIFQNLLAGILILLRQPFEIGDQISSSGYEGTVEEIETRATIIRTYDGKRVMIPNSQIYTDAVTVNTAHDLRRSEYEIGIGYGDDLEKALKIIKETVSQTTGVSSKKDVESLVSALGDSCVIIKARWWTDPQQAEVVHVFSNVLKAVKLALDEAAIDMPYPTNVVLFHDQSEAVDGNRNKQREGWPAGNNVPEPRHSGTN